MKSVKFNKRLGSASFLFLSAVCGFAGSSIASAAGNGAPAGGKGNATSEDLRKKVQQLQKQKDRTLNMVLGVGAAIAGITGGSAFWLYKNPETKEKLLNDFFDIFNKTVDEKKLDENIKKLEDENEKLDKIENQVKNEISKNDETKSEVKKEDKSEDGSAKNKVDGIKNEVDSGKKNEDGNDQTKDEDTRSNDQTEVKTDHGADSSVDQDQKKLEDTSENGNGVTPGQNKENTTSEDPATSANEEVGGKGSENSEAESRSNKGFNFVEFVNGNFEHRNKAIKFVMRKLGVELDHCAQEANSLEEKQRIISTKEKILGLITFLSDDPLMLGSPKVNAVAKVLYVVALLLSLVRRILMFARTYTGNYERYLAPYSVIDRKKGRRGGPDDSGTCGFLCKTASFVLSVSEAAFELVFPPYTIFAEILLYPTLSIFRSCGSGDKEEKKEEKKEERIPIIIKSGQPIIKNGQPAEKEKDGDTQPKNTEKEKPEVKETATKDDEKGEPEKVTGKKDPKKTKPVKKKKNDDTKPNTGKGKSGKKDLKKTKGKKKDETKLDAGVEIKKEIKVENDGYSCLDFL